jgi:hypothetical protein
MAMEKRKPLISTRRQFCGNTSETTEVGMSGSPATPVHAPKGLGEPPVPGLGLGACITRAAPDFGVPLNPTTPIAKLDSVPPTPSLRFENPGT